ncbi:AraC family transcriptional regulator [Amycolatopsis sp. cmx-4-61]|uniref:AraC family transcriptional regulator n=1 Tax=Amycolatopsis sp. cmx-4-61 TaxID=2790937 RepID=UPI00397DE418
MDVFSDVIGSIRAGRPTFCHTFGSGAWGRSFDDFTGAGFHVLLRGACWLMLPGRTPLALSPGDVVLLPHGTRHGLCERPDRPLADLPRESKLPSGADLRPEGPIDSAAAHADMVCGAYELLLRPLHPFLRALPDVVHVPARAGRHPALRAAVDLLAADVVDALPGADAAVPALIDLVMIYTLRAWLQEESERTASTGWWAALADPAITEALQHMHRECSRKWTVQELGEAVGLSRTAFTRRFTSMVGQPPLLYLTNWRLGRAAQLLRETDDPLALIARQVGYRSEFAFANAFRRAFGVPPGRFRRDELPVGRGSESRRKAGATASVR